jgi:hypothetical protein
VTVRGAPGIEDTLDVGSHLIACLSPWDPGHEELVIAGIAVTHRGHDSDRHRIGVQRSAGSTPANPSTTPGSGMGGYGLGPFLRTAREKSSDLIAERVLEGLVLKRSVFGLAQAAPVPRLLVG